MKDTPGQPAPADGAKNRPHFQRSGGVGGLTFPQGFHQLLVIQRLLVSHQQQGKQFHVFVDAAAGFHQRDIPQYTEKPPSSLARRQADIVFSFRAADKAV